MTNKSLYFKDKNNNPELKTITKIIPFQEIIKIKDILNDPKYYTETTTQTITIIPLFRCTNIVSTNPKDKEIENGIGIFCEYNTETQLYFNFGDDVI